MGVTCNCHQVSLRARKVIIPNCPLFHYLLPVTYYLFEAKVGAMRKTLASNQLKFFVHKKNFSLETRFASSSTGILFSRFALNPNNILTRIAVVIECVVLCTAFLASSDDQRVHASARNSELGSPP